MADAAEKDVDEDIARLRVASLKIPGNKLFGWRWDGVGGGSDTHSTILRFGDQVNLGATTFNS